MYTHFVSQALSQYVLTKHILFSHWCTYFNDIWSLISVRYLFLIRVDSIVQGHSSVITSESIFVRLNAFFSHLMILCFRLNAGLHKSSTFGIFLSFISVSWPPFTHYPLPLNIAIQSHAWCSKTFGNRFLNQRAGIAQSVLCLVTDWTNEVQSQAGARNFSSRFCVQVMKFLNFRLFRFLKCFMRNLLSYNLKTEG